MDDFIRLYEEAEEHAREGSDVEATQIYELLFLRVKEGLSADDRSRSRILASKLTKLLLQQENFTRARELYEFLGQTMPNEFYSITRKQTIRTDRVPPPIIIDPDVARFNSSDTIKNLQRLSLRHASLHIAAEAKTDIGEQVFLHATGHPKGWSYQVIQRNKRDYLGGETDTKPQVQQERIDGWFEQLGSEDTLSELFAAMRCVIPTGCSLISGSTIIDSFDDALIDEQGRNHLAAQAWSLFFDTEMPSAADCESQQSSYRERKFQLISEMEQELRSGLPGLHKWNQRPLEERTTLKLTNPDFSNCTWNGVRLNSIDLSFSRFDGVAMGNAIVSNCSLAGGSFMRATVDGALISNSDMADSQFKQASLIGTKFVSVDLTNSCFIGCDLTRSEFQGTRASRALNGVDFSGSSMGESRFTGTDISGADFSKAYLEGATFIGTKYDEQTRFPDGFSLPSGLIKTETAMLNATASVSEIDDVIGRLCFLSSRGGLNFFDIFPQPESEATIEEVEKLLGAELPADYRWFLQKVGGQHLQLAPGFDILPVDRARDAHDDLRTHWQGEPGECSDGVLSITGPVKDLYKNKLWWPILGCGDDYVCIDLDPAPGGSRGQVIFVIVRAYRIVLAQSFTKYLSRMLDFLAHISEEHLAEAFGNDEVWSELNDEFDEQLLSSLPCERVPGLDECD